MKPVLSYIHQPSFYRETSTWGGGLVVESLACRIGSVYVTFDMLAAGSSNQGLHGCLVLFSPEESPKP